MFSCINKIVKRTHSLSVRNGDSFPQVRGKISSCDQLVSVISHTFLHGVEGIGYKPTKGGR
ncbi:hypothetical protein GCM10009621_06530 [Corynebacterium felinum]